MPDQRTKKQQKPVYSSIGRKQWQNTMKRQGIKEPKYTT